LRLAFGDELGPLPGVSFVDGSTQRLLNPVHESRLVDVQRNRRGRHEGLIDRRVLAGSIGALVLESFSRFARAEFGKRASTLTIAMTVRRASVLGRSFVELIVHVLAVGDADTLFADKSLS